MPGPASPRADVEESLTLMLSHQQRLGERLRALEEAGTSVPGCRTTLAEMVTTLARLRREIAREG